MLPPYVKRKDSLEYYANNIRFILEPVYGSYKLRSATGIKKNPNWIGLIEKVDLFHRGPHTNAI